MERVVDVLAIGRVDTTYNKFPQIFSVSPFWTGVALEWNNPLLAFHRQTVQYRLPKWSVWNIEFQQQALLFSFFAFRLTQSAYEVPFGVP